MTPVVTPQTACNMLWVWWSLICWWCVFPFGNPPFGNPEIVCLICLGHLKQIPVFIDAWCIYICVCVHAICPYRYVLWYIIKLVSVLKYSKKSSIDCLPMACQSSKLPWRMDGSIPIPKSLSVSNPIVPHFCLNDHVLIFRHHVLIFRWEPPTSFTYLSDVIQFSTSRQIRNSMVFVSGFHHVLKWTKCVQTNCAWEGQYGTIPHPGACLGRV